MDLQMDGYRVSKTDMTLFTKTLRKAGNVCEKPWLTGLLNLRLLSIHVKLQTLLIAIKLACFSFPFQ